MRAMIFVCSVNDSRRLLGLPRLPWMSPDTPRVRTARFRRRMCRVERCNNVAAVVPLSFSPMSRWMMPKRSNSLLDIRRNVIADAVNAYGIILPKVGHFYFPQLGHYHFRMTHDR